MMERISQKEFWNRCRSQGVTDLRHWAFKCPMCKTVQSLTTLQAASKLSIPELEKYMGFSCVGRWANAGPWPNDKNQTKEAVERRKVPGCDWTLGGLFHIHTLEVVMPIEDGEPEKVRPCFEIATPAEAQALERSHGEVAA